jgi:hypothetical protein
VTVFEAPLGQASLAARAGFVARRPAYACAPRAFFTYWSSTKESTSTSPVSFADLRTETSCFSAETSCGLIAGSKVAMP